MIKKIAKSASILMTVATAQDVLSMSNQFFEGPPQVELSAGGTAWLLGTVGFLLGGTIEAGSNIGAIVPCVGQVSDVAESLYFSYFYIRAFIEKRGMEYITYMSVYVSRGIESTTHGPCWSFKNQTEPAPSSAQMNAETFLSKRAVNAVHKLKQTWESNMDTDEALAELSETTNMIANRLQSSLMIVMTLFTIMEVLEVLIDSLTFADLLTQENWFDGGVLAGKGLVNAGFTIYYLVMEYAYPATNYARFDFESESGLSL